MLQRGKKEYGMINGGKNERVKVCLSVCCGERLGDGDGWFSDVSRLI